MARTVGGAARAVGVSSKAIRIWEAKGLLRPAERSKAGYRLFTEDDIEVLRFIGRAKALGLTLAEIKDILDLHRQGTAPCDQVTTMLDEHIRGIDRTIADLQALRAALSAARRTARTQQRRGQRATICRIIETPTDDAEPTRSDVDSIRSHTCRTD
ncbi:MerR family DNA-binding protein [Mycobacterium angelicum]|uniref:Heavy metal-responsive transcriptional regulator n=1 Tax=Mycobacterium angelicum TaxID=470074 RepID=A0A1X0A7A5_MYCAN|nr:MerR family DNA-binding protein [Mycobacterium angelicum]MCV7194935.1 MerR family DNA-binding protein [Mycobacterium angelicum]ORA25775.1 heavy metal-responsive transcriptional regulator [Mycobacterium angelicum]